MGHFAKVVDGKVTQVIVAEKEFFDTFVDSSPGTWLRTSYNTRGGKYYLPDSNDLHPDQSMALRKNYAGIGYTYDATRDAFIPPQPFASWVLNEDTCQWDSPTPYPTDGKIYQWDEPTLAWVAVPTTTPVETLP